VLLATLLKLKDIKTGSVATLKDTIGILLKYVFSDILSHLETSDSFIEENVYDTYFSPN